MQQAVSCQEGYTCKAGTTNSIMLESKVERGFYGDYNITGKAEFFLCDDGKYCPIGTAASKVKQLDCPSGFFCPLGTAGELNSDGQFNLDTLMQVNKWDLIKEVNRYINESQIGIDEYETTFKFVDIQELIDAAEEAGNATDYDRLTWYREKYELNRTIVDERTKYLNEKLLPTFRCPDDSELPENLIQDYIKNGTNLICPRGT